MECSENYVLLMWQAGEWKCFSLKCHVLCPLSRYNMDLVLQSTGLGMCHWPHVLPPLLPRYFKSWFAVTQKIMDSTFPPNRDLKAWFGLKLVANHTLVVALIVVTDLDVAANYS